MPTKGDKYQVVYVDGDVPQLPIQLGQLLVDSSQISPGTTNLQQCTSQEPVIYEPIRGGYPAIPAEIAAGVTIVSDLYPPGDARRYGATFDGANSQTAMEAALSVAISVTLAESGVVFVATGNLSMLTGQMLSGQGRELTFLRTTHPTNPIIATGTTLNVIEGMTIDRPFGSYGGTGVALVGDMSVAAPVEGATIKNCNFSGHTSGLLLTDFVFANIEDCYFQACTTGLVANWTGVAFSTMLSVKQSWLRGNSSRCATLTGVKSAHFDTCAFESSGASTPLGVEVSAGGVITFTNSWWESLEACATFVGCSSATLDSGFVDGNAVSSQAFYAAGSGGTHTTVVFDGVWEVTNLSATFAVADADSTIIVRSPSLLGETFQAVNGGTVIFDCPLEASATYDPPSIGTLAQGAATTVTVTGAAVGDLCSASFSDGSTDPQNFDISANCFSADTVTVRLFNRSSGTIDMSSGTLSVRVQKRALTS